MKFPSCQLCLRIAIVLPPSLRLACWGCFKLLKVKGYEIPILFFTKLRLVLFLTDILILFTYMCVYYSPHVVRKQLMGPRLPGLVGTFFWTHLTSLPHWFFMYMKRELAAGFWFYRRMVLLGVNAWRVNPHLIMFWRPKPYHKTCHKVFLVHLFTQNMLVGSDGYLIS